MQRHALKLAVVRRPSPPSLVYSGASRRSPAGAAVRAGVRAGRRRRSRSAGRRRGRRTAHRCTCRATSTCSSAPAATSRCRSATTACCSWTRGSTANADKVVAAVRDADATSRFATSSTRTCDPDHVGGNDTIGKLGSTIAGGNVGAGAGVGAGIIAHENVLNRMSAPTGQAGAVSDDRVADRHVRHASRRSCTSTASPCRSIYQPAAHTDGDSHRVLPQVGRHQSPASCSSRRRSRSSISRAAATSRASSRRSTTCSTSRFRRRCRRAGRTSFPATAG